MNRNLLLGLGTLLLTATVGLTGCGDDDDDKKAAGGTSGTGATGATGGTGGTAGTGGGTAGTGGGTAGTGGGLPTGQIDRAGRPAVSTALIPAAKKDGYNQAAVPAWSSFVADIEASLVALDSLDGTPGNNIAAALSLDNTIIATLLANDQLLIDITIDDCDNGYLAQETGAALTNCGGRTLSEDVVDKTLQALVDADNPPTTVVTDAVDANDKPFTDTFPYLASPH